MPQKRIPGRRDIETILHGFRQSYRAPETATYRKKKAAAAEAERKYEEYMRNNERLQVLKREAQRLARLAESQRKRDQRTHNTSVQKCWNELRLNGVTPRLVDWVKKLMKKYDDAGI